MIEMENITKSFSIDNKEVSVLKGISLFIGKGEFVSIMGPSGSGKSTLSSILGCLAKASAGKYSILGEDVSVMSSRQLASLRNKNIGFIFQDFNLLEGLSVIDNVQLPLFYRGITGNASYNRAMECLEAVELTQRAHYMPKQLSGGQKQRVAIARALVNNPSFLFADEPTGSLDQRTGQGIMNLMQKLNFDGQTIVQVTHSQVHCKYSKRILYLVDGLIVRDEVVENPIIIEDLNLSDKDIRDEDDLIKSVWMIGQKLKNRDEKSLNVLGRFFEMYREQKSTLKEAVNTFCNWNCDQNKKFLAELFLQENLNVRSEIILNCSK
ncbi:MAG: ABC transporter ATP-binding protein, partial [Oligoflexia bacterium]|nr:ABC transporter ATP-binding protein [Oligoflexia bacterium]